MKKVIGVGNALTDILVTLPSEELLVQFGLPKGSMCLVDSDFQRRLMEHTATFPRALSPGGSAANTIRAMAMLGAPVGVVAKVGRDETGDFYESALQKFGVASVVLRGAARSGVCVSLVSADGERTMATHLGAALEMTAAEIEPGHFAGFDYLYLEGYLVQNHDLIRHAAATAKRCGLQVVIDLANFNVVEEHREFLYALVKEYVDIVFANEDEARVFTGESDPRRALKAILPLCGLAIVKVGEKGAYICREGGEAIHIGILNPVHCIDTTGAGDYYAAGFLSGLCEGLSLHQCGTMGAIAAGKVIEVVGTTLGDETWQEIRRLVEEVKTERTLF